MLYQNGSLVFDADLTDPHQLIDTLQTFFGYRPQEYAAWEEAVAQFKERVADIGQGLAKLIRRERGTNQTFTTAFGEFLEKCRQAINPRPLRSRRRRDADSAHAHRTPLPHRL